MSMSWAVVVRLGISYDLEPSVWLPPLRCLWKEPHCVSDFLLSSLSLLILFPLLSFFFSSWWISVSHLVWDHHKCFTASTLHENCLLMLRAWCAWEILLSHYSEPQWGTSILSLGLNLKKSTQKSLEADIFVDMSDCGSKWLGILFKPS